VCRLNPQELCRWARAGGFRRWCGRRTSCRWCAKKRACRRASGATGWAAIELASGRSISLTGVLAAVLVPLAEPGTPVFAISTYDTDWILMARADGESRAGPDRRGP
jgi:hypothetical protein